jgi:hypothetical protein
MSVSMYDLGLYIAFLDGEQRPHTLVHSSLPVPLVGRHMAER